MPSNRSEMKCEILTVAQVAAIYGRSIDTIHKWIEAGDLRAFNMGLGTQKPRIGIRPEALVEFEKRRAMVKPPEAPEVKPKRRQKPAREFV